jgi:hypothetical protein
LKGLYREGSVLAVAKRLSKYRSKLDLMGVHEVWCDRGGTEPAGEYIFFYGKGNEKFLAIDL